MKNYTILAILSLGLAFSINCIASCKHVYTIGAYDEAFEHNLSVMKLGPLSASDVPPTLPQTFLENDGSYAGGEVSCTIKNACLMLLDQIANGTLPETENWHIYILDAEWERDVYLLRLNDYRINRPVKVLKLASKNCQDQ